MTLEAFRLFHRTTATQVLVCTEKARLGFPRPGFFIFDTTSRKLFRLGCVDIGDFYIEVKGFSRQRIVEVDHDSLLFDFMDAHGDGLSLRAFRHEHGADLLSVLRNLVFRNLLKDPCRTTFGALQCTGYCWVLMLSAGALELLLGIRPFIE